MLEELGCNADTVHISEVKCDAGLQSAAEV